MLEFDPGAFLAAFAAGFVSFVSPCVLPLIPGYLSFVSGVGFDELGARPRRVVTQTASFVAGFTAMFVALGAGAAWFGDVLLTNRRPLEIVAGSFIAFAGLIYAGAPLPRLLLAEKRVGLGTKSKSKNPFTAALAGVAFSIGWTPCVGPTLAAILALAGAGTHPEQGAVLLAVYSLGLGVPFLLFGLGFTRALGIVRAIRRHWQLVGFASGALLVAFGVLLATGELVQLTNRLARYTGLTI
jgi:cytochrome c-type biogenesis protein